MLNAQISDQMSVDTIADYKYAGLQKLIELPCHHSLCAHVIPERVVHVFVSLLCVRECCRRDLVVGFGKNQAGDGERNQVQNGERITLTACARTCTAVTGAKR
jgi:hypothetical protein